jgi:hypothetical protein
MSTGFLRVIQSMWRPVWPRTISAFVAVDQPTRETVDDAARTGIASELTRCAVNRLNGTPTANQLGSHESLTRRGEP